MTSTLKLTRVQRQKLFAGDVPNISGKGKCPVEKGYVLNLSTKVTLEVLRVIPTSNGWRLHYLLTDKRELASNLRRTPPAHSQDYRFDDSGFPEPLDEAVIAKAAEESAYGARSDELDAGGRVDKITQAQFSKNAQEQNVLRRAEQHDKAEAKRMSQQLRDLKAQARRRGIDISPEIRAAAEAFKKAEEKLTNGGTKAA